MSLIIFCFSFSSESSDVDYAPSVFETAARREGRKSEGDALKRELEECDPDDPEFDPTAEPPVERRGGRRVKGTPSNDFRGKTPFSFILVCPRQIRLEALLPCMNDIY